MSQCRYGVDNNVPDFRQKLSMSWFQLYWDWENVCPDVIKVDNWGLEDNPHHLRCEVTCMRHPQWQMPWWVRRRSSDTIMSNPMARRIIDSGLVRSSYVGIVVRKVSNNFLCLCVPTRVPNLMTAKRVKSASDWRKSHCAILLLMMSFN